MENTKKIINNFLALFLCCFFVTCCNTKKHYYDEQGNEIGTEKIKNIKLNIYEGEGEKIYLLSDKKIRKADSAEKINSKTVGFILQDSIQLINGDYKNIAQIVDIKSYQELDKNLLYLDKKNVYYNFKSDMTSYPYGILDLNPTKISLIDGYYIKDEKNVYSYGGISCKKLNHVNVSSFYTKKFKNLSNNEDIHLAFDNKKIFHNADEMTLADLEEIPINQKLKDSLKIIYFSN